MSIASVVTRGFFNNKIPARGYIAGSGPTPTPTITGGHFIPEPHGGKKRTLSNVLTVYNRTRELSRKDTKQLRDIISEFVDPEIAMVASLPDFSKIDYEMLKANAAAHEKFMAALEVVHNNLVILDNIQKEDDEFFELVTLSCTIN